MSECIFTNHKKFERIHKHSQRHMNREAFTYFQTYSKRFRRSRCSHNWGSLASSSSPTAFCPLVATVSGSITSRSVVHCFCEKIYLDGARGVPGSDARTELISIWRTMKSWSACFAWGEPTMNKSLGRPTARPTVCSFITETMVCYLEINVRCGCMRYVCTYRNSYQQEKMGILWFWSWPWQSGKTKNNNRVELLATNVARELAAKLVIYVVHVLLEKLTIVAKK